MEFESKVFSMAHLVRELLRILQKPHLLPTHGDQWSCASDLQASPCRDWQTDRQIGSKEAQQGKPEALACAPSVTFKMN